MDSTKVKNTKGVILKTIILIGIIIKYKLSLIKSPIILLKGLRLYLIALRFNIIELKSSSRLGGYCFRVILIVGDYYSTLNTILNYYQIGKLNRGLI